jgi:glycosyltransferase involved in cell wall biosynthesis
MERFPYQRRHRIGPYLLSPRVDNPACTLRAFARVQKRWPHATLTFAGSTTRDHELEAFALTLGLRYVTFAGHLEYDDVPGYYAANDIYVQSSNIDAMSDSIRRAQASGLPVVATDAPGLSTLITHGRDGLVAAKDDHDALAPHVLFLLEQPAVASALAHNAYARCRGAEWTRTMTEQIDAAAELRLHPGAM